MTAFTLVALCFASVAPPSDAPADAGPAAPSDAPSVAPPVPHTPSAKLKLSDVLADVEAKSPVIGASKARADALSRSADATGFWDEPFLAVGPDEISISDRMPVILFQVSQVVPFPGKRGARAEAARDQATAATRDTDVTTRTLRVAATQTFLRAKYLVEARRTNALLQQALREVQASASARYITGSGAHHDALLADAELAVLERDALLLDRAARAAMINLAALRGKPLDPDAAALAPPELVDDVAFEAAASFDDAIAAQPELLAARARVEAADADARARSLAAFPDLTVQLMAMASFMPDEPSNVGAMAGVALPIFFPWKQDKQTEAARRNADAQRANVAALLLALRTEWEQARQDLRSAEDTAALYTEKILPATKLALDSSETAYATKETPLVEVLAVIRAYHQAALESEAAKLDVHIAHLRLNELLSQASVMQLAPSAPTLFSSSGGMRSMGAAPMGPAMGATPLRMGSGMSAPAPGLVGGDEATSGMGGMP